MIAKIVKIFLKKLNLITVGNFRAKILSQMIVQIVLKHSNKKEAIKETIKETIK